MVLARLAALVRLPLPPLPGGVRVCYKPDMRKWMHERLKRRKKASEKSTGESAPAPAPLQPAYFDTDTPKAPPPIEAQQPEPEETQAVQEPRATPPAQREGAGTGQRRRRRRRGGRGRGRGGTQSGQPALRTGASAQSSLQEAGPAAVAVHQPPRAATAPAPAPASPAVARAPKGVVVLAIGLPGSGKSSWFKRHNITPLSSDLLRALLFDDPTEQRFQDLIFSNLRSMLKARLIARRPMNYVDATNLTPHERHSWIKLAKDFGYEVQAVYFDVPLEVCLERNQRRQRVVSEDVMRRMAAKLRPPTFGEGFTKVTVVRVKKKE
jgi:predicted kinase